MIPQSFQRVGGSPHPPTKLPNTTNKHIVSTRNRPISRNREVKATRPVWFAGLLRRVRAGRGNLFPPDLRVITPRKLQATDHRHAVSPSIPTGSASVCVSRRLTWSSIGATSRSPSRDIAALDCRGPSAGTRFRSCRTTFLGHGPKLMDLRDGVAAMTGYPSGLKVRNPPCPVAREIRFLARCLMRRRMSARRQKRN